MSARAALAAIVSIAQEIEKSLPKQEFPTEFVLDAPLTAVQADLEKLKARTVSIVAEHKALVAERKAQAEAEEAKKAEELSNKQAMKDIADALKEKHKK